MRKLAKAWERLVRKLERAYERALYDVTIERPL